MHVTVTNHPTTGVVELRAPYDTSGVLQDIFKSLGYRWQPDRKIWTATYNRFGFDNMLETLTQHLRHHGHTYAVIQADEPRQRQQREQRSSYTPPTRPNRTVDTWAMSMFAALSPDLGDKAYKALSRVLHPDTGGDTRAQQVLNDAWSVMRPKAGAR